MDDVDLPVDKDQPYDATTASQNSYTFEFGFGDDRTYTPAPEPGPLRVSRSCEVFNVVPQSESESEEEIQQDDSAPYLWYQPDAEPGSEDEYINSEIPDQYGDGEIHAACFEDLRVSQVEDARQLHIEQELDGLGSSVLSAVAKDNIKAMALKIGNQLTRNAFEGV